MVAIMENDPVVRLAEQLRASEQALRAAARRYAADRSRANGEAVNAVLADIKSLHRELMQTEPTSMQGAAELVRLAERLARAIRALQALRARAQHSAGQTAAPLQALFGHIAALVQQMQIYDATRQRLEHIEQAVSEAAGLLDAGDASGCGAESRRGAVAPGPRVGRKNVTVVPTSAPDSMLTVPPCACTSSCTIDSPRPRCRPVLRAPSTW